MKKNLIEPYYEVGDEVFIVHENTLRKTKVYSIDIHINHFKNIDVTYKFDMGYSERIEKPQEDVFSSVLSYIYHCYERVGEIISSPEPGEQMIFLGRISKEHIAIPFDKIDLNSEADDIVQKKSQPDWKKILLKSKKDNRE